MDTRGDPHLVRLERAVTSFCAGTHRDPTHGHLLLVFGPNGTGKTHCAKAVARWMNSDGMRGKMIIRKVNDVGPVRIEYWHWPQLLDQFKGGYWDLVDQLFESEVVILDDIGSGHDPSKVGTDKLCQVLSRRERRWTMITTNVMPTDWAAVFDVRTTSRFIRNSTVIDLTGVGEYALRAAA